MTLSNFLTEAAVNYKIGSGNPEKMLYDFYVLSFISTINLSPEKSKTTTFGDIGFQGGFLSKADRVKEDIEYAQDVLLPVLREKLIKGLFISICAEIRHIKDRPQTYTNTPLATSKVFRDYYRTYTLLDKGVPKEFEPKRLREPKGATPNAAGYKRSYQAAIRAIKDQNSTPYEFVKLCKYAFENMSWAPSYGGKKWGEICGGYLLLVDAKSKDQVSVAIDHAYDLEHNTGAALNKVKDFYIVDDKGRADFDWMGDALDLKRDATSMKKLIDRCSGDMKRLALQAMALSPIDYMKKKTPAPEAVMQQKAQAVGGEYAEAFNEGAPKKYRVKTETKETKSSSGTLFGYPIAPVPFQGFTLIPSFEEGELYYDAETKCYVVYVGPTNKNIPILSVYAVTHQTNIGKLNSLIDNFQPGYNSYVVKSIGDIKGLDKKDADNAEAAVNASKKQDSKPYPKQYVAPFVTAPYPKTLPKIYNESIYKKNELYFDEYMRTYVEFIKYNKEKNANVVHLVAITDNTNVMELNKKIASYEGEADFNNTYLTITSFETPYPLYKLDESDIIAVSKIIRKNKKGHVGSLYKEVDKLPVVPKPQEALSKLSTITPDEHYYETAHDTFIKIEALPNFSGIVRAFPVAITSKTDKDKLKEAIIYNPKLAFNISKGNVYELSYKDKVDLSLNLAASHAKEPEKKKPDLNLDIPQYKKGDYVFLDAKRTVIGEIIESYVENSKEMYKIKTVEVSLNNNEGYENGKIYNSVAKWVDSLNPIFKVNDRVILIKSTSEGIIVQKPSKQDINSSFIIKITKPDSSKAFTKGEEIVANIRSIAPLTREESSGRTNAYKKANEHGDIPIDAWSLLNDKQKSVLVPYKRDANTSYVFFTQKEGRTVGLYGKINGVKKQQDGDNAVVIVKFIQLLPNSEKSYFNITENRFDDLKDYPSALKDIVKSPLYNAPYQNLDAAPLLKKGEAKVGNVYYDITKQQYVKLKSSNNNFYEAVPVAKTKFTPAYETFNWGKIFISSIHLQELTNEAAKYLTEFAGDIVKELIPKEEPKQEMPEGYKLIPVETTSTTDFLNIVNSSPVTKETKLSRDQLYYDFSTRYVVKLVTTKKQFGEDSDTIDAIPQFKINTSGKFEQNTQAPKQYTVHISNLHEFYD